MERHVSEQYDEQAESSVATTEDPADVEETTDQTEGRVRPAAR